MVIKKIIKIIFFSFFFRWFVLVEEEKEKSKQYKDKSLDGLMDLIWMKKRDWKEEAHPI